jgi:6-phosphogluconolactonase
MSVRRQKYPDAIAAADACADEILNLLEDAVAGQELATIAVSGGTSPKRMFDTMAAAKFNWNRVHFFWVDERVVPPTDPASNYKLTFEHFLQPARIPVRQVHRVWGEMLPASAAQRYEEEIRAFFGLAQGEMPHFDIVHRGVGPDAHTASLFPGDPLIEDHERIVGSTYVEKFRQSRVTLLPGPLRAAKRTVMLVTGNDKKEAVRAVFHEEYNPMKYPAQIATRDGYGVNWFLDEAAAQLLE